MKSNDRLELAHWAVKKAQTAGAAHAAVNINKTREVDISVRESKIDKLSESTQNSLSISVYVDNKYSSHSTNDLRKDALGGFIEEAVAMTKYLSEDLHRKLPDPKYYEGRQSVNLDLYDNNYESLTSEERIEIANQIEKAVKDTGEKIVTCTSGFGDSMSESVKVHSNGFEGERKSTYFGAGVEVTVKDDKSETGGLPSDWCWPGLRHFSKLPSAEEIGKEAVKRAISKIGQSKIESGKYDMIVENRTASRILGTMFRCMNGSSIQQKSSYLDGMLDKSIASEKLTITDDPFIPGASGSRLYNNEGMATQKRVLIDKGVLKTYLIDNYYASKMGVDPTGAQTSNLIFELGDKSFDEMIAGVEKGIAVTSFIGGNSNSTTGDFSYGIMGLYIENGKIVKPINEMNVSGNFMNLMANLIDVGNDPWIYSSWRRPSLHFKEVNFSGL